MCVDSEKLHENRIKQVNNSLFVRILASAKPQGWYGVSWRYRAPP